MSRLSERPEMGSGFVVIGLALLLGACGGNDGQHERLTHNGGPVPRPSDTCPSEKQPRTGNQAHHGLGGCQKRRCVANVPLRTVAKVPQTKPDLRLRPRSATLRYLQSPVPESQARGRLPFPYPDLYKPGVTRKSEIGLDKRNFFDFFLPNSPGPNLRWVSQPDHEIDPFRIEGSRYINHGRLG